MATLKDVAKLANVDASTVSRALNNTSYVHPDTKERVLKAVKELSYRPNVLAQGLRQGKRYTVGVVLPKLYFTIFAEVLRGIEKKAEEHHYCTLVCSTEDDFVRERECLNRLRNGFVDGIIVAGTGKSGRLLRDMKASDIPLVQIIRNQEREISSVVADYEAAAYQAVRYLADKGCKQIGFINSALSLRPYHDRYKGYISAVKRLKLEEIYPTATEKMQDFAYGFRCAEELLNRYPLLEGMIAANDILGMGAIRAMSKNKRRIPEDVKLMSLNGHSVGEMLQVSMTSMEIPAALIGEKAMELLLEEIQSGNRQGQPAKHLVFNTRLVEREST